MSCRFRKKQPDKDAATKKIADTWQQTKPKKVFAKTNLKGSESDKNEQ